MAVPLTLPSVGVTTSESLIQKLRGAADPIPVPISAEGGGPSHSISKIHLATLAWTQSQDPSPSSAVHIPQVSSLLLTWLIDSLARAAKGANSKAKADSTTALADPEYYTLLHHLLRRSSSKGRESISAAGAFPPQTVLNIASSLLALPQEDLRRCIPPAAQPLVLLLRPVVSSLANGQATRVTLDKMLTDIFQASASLDSSDSDLAQGLAKILQVIKDPWLDATAESSLLSQKSHSTFITSSLPPCCQALDTLASISLPRDQSQSFHVLRQLILDLLHGCLFGLYGIKSVLFPTAFASNVAPTVSLLQAITDSSDIVASPLALSQLAWASIRSTRRHSNELQTVAKTHTSKSDASAVTEEDTVMESGHTNLHAHLFDSFLRPLLDVALPYAKACASIMLVFAESNLSSSLSRHPPWYQTLTSTARALISTLQTSSDGVVLEHFITALHTLWQIDQDAVRSDIPHLLSSLCMPASASLTPACQTQAQLLLDDLIKTFARSQETPEMLYMLGHAFSSSPQAQWHDQSIFPPRYMNTVLSTCVRTSITPPQLKQTLGQTLDLIRSALSASPSTNVQNGKKRNSAQAEEDAGEETNSTRVTNVLRYVHPILASMPIPAAVIPEVRPTLQSISSTLTSLLSTVLSSQQNTGTPLKKARKGDGQGLARGKTQGDSTSTDASALWAFYGFCAGLKTLDMNSSESDFPETAQALASLNSLWPTLLSVAIQDPTVQLETVRLVLFAQELRLEGGRGDTLPSEVELQPLWAAVVRLLDTATGLTQQTSLWEVLLTRFAFVLEHTADRDVLLSLSQTLINSLHPKAPSSNEPLQVISLRACQNAEFLELAKWRECITSLISTQCQDSDSQMSDIDRLERLSVLAHFPLQYIAHDTREELLILAFRLAAEVGTGTGTGLVQRWLLQAAQSDLSGSFSEKVTVAVKASLPSLVSEGEQTVELVCAWIARLVESKRITADELQSFVDSHMHGMKVQVAVAETLVALSAGVGSDLVGAVRFPALTLEKEAAGGEGWTNASAVTEYLKHARLTLVLAGVEEEQQQAAISVVTKAFIALTHRLAEFAHDDEDSSSLAQEYLSLAAVLLRSHTSSNVNANIEALRISEETMHGIVVLLSSSHKDAQQDDVVDRAFSQLMRLLTPEQYDVILSRLAARQQVESDHLRGVVRVLSSALRFGPEGTLVIAQRHFTRFLLRVQLSLHQGHSSSSASEDTTVLSHLEALSTICTNRAMVLRTTDAPVILSILSLIVSPCSSSHTSLRTAQSTPLFTRRALAHEIFTCTLDILNTLIRLRKDILKPVVSQLSLFLTQLPRLFVRPTIANTSTRSRQMRVFLGSIPPWLARSFVADRSGSDTLAQEDHDADDAEDGEEDTKKNLTLTLDSSGGLSPANARQFARVLDALTSKNASAVGVNAFQHRGKDKDYHHPPSTSTTDSLARPISKHAIYILTAYIHALLHPIPSSSSSSVMRGLIPPDTRKELLTGLQTLCGVVNESERDWMLAVDVLDDAGKGVFKEVWRAWEAERYKGE